MKSATETFESSMRRVVEFRKCKPEVRVRNAVASRRAGACHLLACPEPSVPRSRTVGPGRQREGCREDPQRETGRASPRKGKKKREVKRLSGCGKNKIKIKWGSWGKWPSNLSMQPTDPFAVFPLFWLVSKNIPEGKRIELPSQTFEKTSVWLSLQELLVCPERDNLYAFCWMSPDTGEHGAITKRMPREAQLWAPQMNCLISLFWSQGRDRPRALQAWWAWQEIEESLWRVFPRLQQSTPHRHLQIHTPSLFRSSQFTFPMSSDSPELLG